MDNTVRKKLMRVNGGVALSGSVDIIEANGDLVLRGAGREISLSSLLDRLSALENIFIEQKLLGGPNDQEILSVDSSNDSNP